MLGRTVSLGILGLAVAALMLVAAPGTTYAGICGAQAPADFGNTSLQDSIDAVTLGGASGVDVNNDCAPDTSDSIWTIDASGGSIATIIIEVAAFADDNTFGVFDPKDETNRVELFDGSGTTGDQVALSVFIDGSILVNFVDSGVDFSGTTFGYYLDSTANVGGGLWFSATQFNSDGEDHLQAYQGNNIDFLQIGLLASGLFADNEWILAFEDLDASVSDWDYSDFVVLVESVRPVAEPSALTLLGFGLVALGFVALRRRKLAVA